MKATSILIPVLGLMLTGGCGSQTAPPKTSQPSNPKPTATANAAAGEKPAATTNKYVRTDADGRKWIADIPYDVFFDDPLAVVSNSQTVAAAPATAASTAAPANTPEPTPSPPAATGGEKNVSDWKTFIPMEQLQEETKRIRNHLTSGLQSQGTYNGNYKELQVDGAELAAIAEIVAKHSEDVSWKANAKYIRDLGAELSQSATALGKEPYSKSQATAEKIVSVLDGNIPADVGSPAPDRPFGEVASRAGVMKRIEKAKDWMKLELNTEAKFKADLEKVKKEATWVATLGKVVSDESYESASEDDYKGFVKNLIDAGKEAAAAAQDQSYPKYNDAINKMQKACDQCHASYGNG